MVQPKREHLKQDAADHMRYYNQERFHSSNGDMSSVKLEISQIKHSCLGGQEHCLDFGDLRLPAI